VAVPTRRGLALLAAGGAAYLAARVLGTWELYLLAVCLGAAPLIAWLLVALTARRLRGRREIGPKQPIAGDPVKVAIHLKNRSVLPGPQLLVSEYAGVMSAGTGLEIDSLRSLEERLVVAPPLVAHRGVHRLPAPLARAEDPLGLACARLRFGEPAALTVAPRLAHLSSCALFPGMSARRDRGPHGLSVPGSSDLRSVRPHRPGEPLSRIHWKATARTGTLMLREMDEPAGSDVTLLLDVPSSLAAGTAPDTSVELAVGAAGSIADFALRAGRTVTMLLPQDEWRRSRLNPGVEGRALLLESLARVAPHKTTRLGSSLRALLGSDGRRPGRLHAVVLVVLALDRELEYVLLRLRDEGLQVSVVHVDAATFGARSATSETEHLVAALEAAGVRTIRLRRGDDLGAALSYGPALRQQGGLSYASVR
jgi:uncharacterized protein (DUF58 family)